MESPEMQNSIVESSEIFEDQLMNHAVGYIEIYKLKHGTYPTNLKSIAKINEIDLVQFKESFEYKKLADGYKLNMIKGFVNPNTQLKYPKNHWKGTGLKESNTISN